MADLKTYRIPNRFCTAMAVSGVLLRGYLYGTNGFFESVRGMVIPFVVLFVIFAIHVIGAGDVKLLCGIGAYAGDDIWKILTYTCVMTGVAALIKGVAFRTPRMGLQAEGRMYGMKQHTRMHLSVPIAFGCVWYGMEGLMYGI